jgi:hypothetical protein
MKLQTKNTLRGMAKLLGLKVVFVSYFSADVHGKLLPREKRILINAHKPRYENIFTLLHEIGHFLIHFKTPHRKHHPHFLEIDWKIEWVLNLCSIVRRLMRRLFTKDSSKEWEADLWAFCAFFCLAKATGCRNDMLTFLDHHPEKFWVFMLAASAVFYCGIKYRITKPFKMLLRPFRAG